MYYLYLDLNELPELFNGFPGWTVNSPGVVRFDRTDHLGKPKHSLDESVRRLVAERTGQRPEGPIRLLTQLRHFGYCFNPVSFYYCFDGADDLQTVLAEVHNTPWNEEHVYTFSRQHGREQDGILEFRFDKDFHVSPFLPMQTYYEMTLNSPGQELFVQIDSHQESRRIFRAAMRMERKTFTRKNAYQSLFKYPIMSAQVIGRIYYEALRLWWKGATFHPHPEGSTV
jgi:DUF1365 family protein